MEAFWDRVHKGIDVAWLEQIASSPEFLYREWAERVGDVAVSKQLRTDAYVRLGALGTAESLAAVSRVDGRLRGGRTLPESSASGWHWESPAAGMGGLLVTPQSGVAIGRRHYAVMLLSPYSPTAPHLSWRDDGDNKWSRPHLAGDPIGSLSDLETRLASAPPGLVVSFSLRPIPAGVVTPRDVPASRQIKIDDVERDTDRDGWTDLEERALGMDAARADSDGDGIADDRDVTPMYAARAGEDADEDAQILRRAFFAAYGLTGSHFAIFVRPEMRRVQLNGISGPVLFGVDLPDRNGCGRGGRPCPPTRGAEVAWERGKSATTATVIFTTWQGSSFWSRSRVRLQKISGEWVVVEFALVGIT
jgi:hypothetical protein